VTPEQTALLWRAAQQSGLPADSLSQLRLENPYRFSGPVAERLQSVVAQLDAVQAREWISEAGASVSLAAAAAAQGLAPMSPQLQMELDRLQPRTADEQRQARIEQLMAAQPFGTPGQYVGQGDEATYVPGQEPNLTMQMELMQLDPALAQRLQAEAQPPAPAMHPGDAAVLARFGYSTTTAAA
jgi:hypothetical protein